MAGMSAEMGHHNIYPQMASSHHPTIPPKAPLATIAYARATNEAPITALIGVIGPKQPDKHQPASRHRMRKQVGSTNRWRLPEFLGSDLLGSSQALKATRSPLNKSIIKIMTAESQKLTLNLDMTQAYSFHPRSDRPVLSTTPAESPELPLTVVRGNMLPVIRPDRIPFLSKYIPGTVHPVAPMEVFQYLSKDSVGISDVLLHCLDMDWELHRSTIRKSSVLSDILHEADKPKSPHYFKGADAESRQRNVYHKDYSTLSSRNLHRRLRKTVDNLTIISRYRASKITLINLEITEPLVTEHALAVALGNLYQEVPEVEVEDAVKVLAAANVVGFHALREGCANIMLANLNYKTVCPYHYVASKLNEEKVTEACESWLEVNLIPKLANHIQLRQLSFEVLQKVIKSNRLFTFNEHSLYKLLCDWLFLQLNPDIQLMPCHSTILTYFNGFSKVCSLLEREETNIYEPLFAALRLHGIIDTNHLRDMQMMNIVPQAWVVNVLSLHYQGLQGGGDMTAFKNFSSACIRTGFIIDEVPHYHSEILSLYGFHFELKAVKQEGDSSYSFFMQRLKPNDSVLSFRDCERHTFSLRPDRLVNYTIRIQCRQDGKPFFYSTRMLSQKFGLRESISQSDVVTLERLETPIFVSFSILFPSS